MLEVDEYERLLRAAESRELDNMMASGTEDFVDARDAASRIAGTWLTQARKSAGLTQQQLARKAGVPQSQISRIERNPDRTTMRTIRRIAAALGLKMDALISFSSR
ncbi:MAG: helix-turn-helix transcriptional regulator [Phycisphaerae bacterium]